MKKSAILISIYTTLCLLSGHVFAMQPGHYAGVGYGISRIKAPNFNSGNPGSSYSESKDGQTWRLLYGYNLTDFFGIEAGVSKYADAKRSLTSASGGSESLTYSMTTLDLLGKVYVPVFSQKLNAYALGGGSYVQNKLKHSASANTIPAITGSDTTYTGVLKYGAGISFQFNGMVAATIEASRIKGKGDPKTDASAVPDADMLTLNILYF